MSGLHSWNCKNCAGTFYLETAENNSMICPFCGSTKTYLAQQNEDFNQEENEKWLDLDEYFKNKG